MRCITIKIWPMRCEYIIQQDIKWCNNQFAIEVRVHCH